MNNIKYLDLYYEYLKVLDKKRNELGMFLAAKEDENAYKVIYYKEIIRKIYVGLIITDAFLMMFAGLIYSIIKEYFEIGDIIYYLIFGLIINAGLIIAIFIFKNKIKKLKEKSNVEESQKLKEEFRIETEKIYKICPFIIIINQYYYELHNLEREQRMSFYQERVKDLQKTINFALKGNVNTEKYKEYLEKWISKNKE